ncbi:MAG: hypothetical protein A2496_18280 [Burkholderiales bacterium RIFOXYC12_FULL_60_6]|nr:MAG: hypothetical protein A2503_02075 [Burkholderiales bacterium RIFOXYD12_FULL_59_19]OGB81233.1 MAG: hypothetical protein A2496_18280 [Burkholderiales bacterium RIFOXYC12_FULL_60_6]
MVLVQDTGGAIRGAVRAVQRDVFFGFAPFGEPWHDVMRSSTRRGCWMSGCPPPFCLRLRWVGFAGSGGAIV